MKKILQFKNPKQNNPFVMKVMIATLIVLAILKLPEVFDKKLRLYREHSVIITNSPIKLPEGYLVYDLNGNSHKLNEMLGDNLTILAFWATWCGYCAKEMPVMAEIIPYLQNHGVKIIPIARGDDTPEKIKEFFKRGDIRNTESVIASNRNLHKELGVASYPTFIAVKDGMAFANLRPEWGSKDIFALFEELQKK